MTTIDSRGFRNALGAFTTGVTIVTTRDRKGQDIGLTANSFNSVSLDPPMVLWSLAKSSLSLAAFIEADHFAVHILAADQQALSDRFAKRGVDKFGGLFPERGHGGIPLLDGCAARFECRTAFRYAGGDHEIFVGEVITFEHFDRAPLVYMAGQYAVAVHQPPAEPAMRLAESDASFSRSSLSYLVANAHYLLDRHLRTAMARLGLDRAQTYALSLLGLESPRALGALNAQLSIAGVTVDEAALRPLVARGLVSIAGSGDAASVALTDNGRTMTLETLAVIKAAEEDAGESLDFHEAQMLRALLRRLVRGLANDTMETGA